MHWVFNVVFLLLYQLYSYKNCKLGYDLKKKTNENSMAVFIV